MWRKNPAEQNSEDQLQEGKGLAAPFCLELPEWALNCFIVAHIFAVTVWLLPNNPLKKVCLNLVTPYIAGMGLWQTWAVFAPDPKTWTTYVTARVTFQDGTKREWDFCRLEKLDYLTRLFKDRDRKWAESVNDNRNYRVWPDTCNYIARQFTDKQNPPVLVSLIRHWEYMKVPELKAIEGELPRRYHGKDGKMVLFTYLIEASGQTK